MLPAYRLFYSRVYDRHTQQQVNQYILFLFWASELKDGIVPPKMWLSNCRQATKKDYLGDNLHPRCRYAFSVPVAASNSPRYGGEGFIGLEENSGWNWTPTKYGWSTRQTSKKITQCRKKIVENFQEKTLLKISGRCPEARAAHVNLTVMQQQTSFHKKQLTTKAEG